MNNVIPFPQPQQTQYGQPVYQVAPDGSLLPSFPLVAAKVDSYAKRIPWYVWLPLGAYLMFRLLKRR